MSIGEQFTERAYRCSRKRWARRLLWLAVSVVILSSLAIVSVSFYVGWNLTHPERRALDVTPDKLNLVYQDFSVSSKLDEVELRGWWLEAEQAHSVVIMAHGYRSNRLEGGMALDLAGDLVQLGYHVLMFDFRNSGESSGDMTTVGYHEKHDLLTMVDYAQQQFPDLPLGLLGFSMGASTSLLAAGEDTRIQAIVADSPFSDLREYLEDNLPYWSNLPHYPFTPLILSILPTVLNLDVQQVSPREAIRDVSAPVLLIHGDGDVAIPYENSKQILAHSKGNPIEFWAPEQSGHVAAYKDYPEEYVERVHTFFSTAFHHE
jgi:dipeptidyl aminopeptidase/acylaminoacyl peptidase